VTWTLHESTALEALADYPGGHFDAVVTSPPYADQRTYNGSMRRTTKNASRRQRAGAPAVGAQFVIDHLPELGRVLSPSGSLALNLGVIMRDGEETAWVEDVLAGAREQGWAVLQRVVWHKPNSLPLSHPTYLHVKHEYVLWLAHDAAVAYRGLDENRAPHSETSLRRIREAYMSRKDERYAKRGRSSYELHELGARPATVFTAGVGGQRVDHPAPMAPELARFLVALSCPPGGLVLDPFAGSGTTGLAALESGRRFVGIEPVARYAAEARARLAVGRFPRLTRPVADGQESLL
jgi:DNA modification methylase